MFSVRALIDSGSQATFISEKLQRKLNLPCRNINAHISGLNNAVAGSVQRQCSLLLGSSWDSQFKLEVEGLVLPNLTGNLPSDSIDVSRVSSLIGIHLADPNFAKSSQGEIFTQTLC